MDAHPHGATDSSPEPGATDSSSEPGATASWSEPGATAGWSESGATAGSSEPGATAGSSEPGAVDSSSEPGAVDGSSEAGAHQRGGLRRHGHGGAPSRGHGGGAPSGGRGHGHGHGNGGHHPYLPVHIDLTALAVPDTMALLRPVLPEPPAAICEVGAGLGALAAALAGAGYRVTAIEPDPDSAAAAAERGLEVVNAELRDHRAPGRYDAVLFTRSLHHIEDLPGAIEHALDLLTPSGVLVLEEFARERANEAAARFLYDAVDLLAAAGVAAAEPEDDEGRPRPTDPWQRWQDSFVPSGHESPEEAAHRPLHTGADIVAALQAAGLTVTDQPTIGLWRMIAQRLADTPVANDVARRVRDTEARRLADGSLPALGRFLVARR
ncbi:methyltransferase domain-containing protein [Actinocatenispora sera]|uniref:class I SAM-dependent methyltransferase n=1 Tax=Actinocatenispora sera TaxID=390989 RepID=UPI00340E6177